jgi:hypothetical protein
MQHNRKKVERSDVRELNDQELNAVAAGGKVIIAGGGGGGYGYRGYAVWGGGYGRGAGFYAGRRRGFILGRRF